ncbi:YveK family protein [Nocardioides sp. SYSU DS0651]|uniref:YveK family protein n=1 Tax=Nocardioides sp. SYSU DS0651 TaxID=3415955 RepID=UPI003F4BF20D
MDIADYWRALRRSWWAVLIAVVVTASLALAGSFLAPVKYESSSRVLIAATPSDTPTDAYQGQLLAEKMVGLYAELVTSELMAELVLEDVQTDIGLNDWTDVIGVQVSDGSTIITIRARSGSATTSRELAQLTAEGLVDYVSDTESDSQLAGPVLQAVVLDPAAEPAEPASPQPIRNAILGVLLGLVIGGAIAVLRYRRPKGASVPSSSPGAIDPASRSPEGSTADASSPAPASRRRHGGRRRNA